MLPGLALLLLHLGCLKLSARRDFLAVPTLLRGYFSHCNSGCDAESTNQCSMPQPGDNVRSLAFGQVFQSLRQRIVI